MITLLTWRTSALVVVAVYLPAIAAIFTGTGATWVINTFAMLPCVALLTNTPEKKNRYYVFDLTRKKKKRVVFVCYMVKISRMKISMISS